MRRHDGCRVCASTRNALSIIQGCRACAACIRGGSNRHARHQLLLKGVDGEVRYQARRAGNFVGSVMQTPKRTFRTSTEVCLCSPRVCPIAPQCIRPINVSNNECVPPQPKVTSQASPDRKTLDHLGVHLHQRHLCAHGSVSRRFPRGWRHGRRVAPRKSVLHLELPLSSRTPLPHSTLSEN